jgi:hypothetical protein
VAVIASTGNQEKEKILKQLRIRESQRATARKLRYLRGKLNRNSTTVITIKNKDGTTSEINNKTRNGESNHQRQQKEI